MLIRLFALIATLFASTAARAAEPLQPTGKWIVNFDEAQCVAFRNYGSKEKPLYLRLKAPPLGSVMQVSVIRKGARLNPRQSSARLTFGKQQPIEGSLLSFRGDKAELQAHMINVPVHHLHLMKQEKTLAIHAPPWANYRFALSQMEPLLKIMDECVADLRGYWNVDQARATSSEPGPVGNEGKILGLFNSEDYPAVAIDEMQQGTATFVVLIDQNGKVADCAIVETSGVAALDSQSCAIIRERGRFQPGVGPDGKPARSALVQEVSWRVE